MVIIIFHPIVLEGGHTDNPVYAHNLSCLPRSWHFFHSILGSLYIRLDFLHTNQNDYFVCLFDIILNIYICHWEKIAWAGGKDWSST